MHNSIAHGRRIAVWTVIFQLGAVGLVGMGFCLRGWREALAAWVGGAVIAMGNALFAWRLFADGVAPGNRVARAVYAAEVLKWVWLAFALYGAIAVLGLPALALIVGVIAAQFAFWVAVGLVR